MDARMEQPAMSSVAPPPVQNHGEPRAAKRRRLSPRGQVCGAFMRVVTVCIACRLVRGRAPTTASPLERVRERGCSPRTDLVYSELGRTVG
ncbi:hypothetical protein HPB47_012480 [Ixodes persulcatus]|uniref:Uncharacterized protein n=1 Tax=Ixodes persulcatus TaxID=34615 RepID=A0AC60NTG6_IXOPE|nr:hypothetical protein HPB47_012480 [Ixodes persulcatus]